MKLTDLVDNFVYVELYGEALYSGSSETHGAFLTTQFYEKYKEVIDSYTPHFSDLDGKHSSVEGTTTVTELKNLSKVKKAVINLVNADDNWMIFDSMLDEVDPDERLVVQSMDEEILSECSKKEVTYYYFNGECL